MKIAVFGAAFNPPHRGHVAIIRNLSATFDRVIVAPSFRHAFGKTTAPFYVRFEMLELALEDEHLKNVFISPIEHFISLAKNDDSPIYSIDLLDKIQSEFPHDEIILVIGPDNAEPSVFSKFKDSERITDEFGIHVVPEIEGFRSTACRKLVGENTEASFLELSLLVGNRVAECIKRLELYQPEKEEVLP